MTKYTRNIKLVTEIIEDIFAVDEISNDTKAITLVLAATMDLDHFLAFIQVINQLSSICIKLIELNTLRWKYGSSTRDYIIQHAIVASTKPVSSDELQQFISNTSLTSGRNIQQQLTPALHADLLKLNDNWQVQIDTTQFATAKQQAVAYLVDRLCVDSNNDNEIIREAFLQCRCTEQPLIAYYAVIYAIADILVASGLETQYALIHSHKLANHALDQFTQHKQRDQSMLRSYKS